MVVEVVEASEVNEAAGISKTRKIIAEDFRFTLVFELINQNCLVES